MFSELFILISVYVLIDNFRICKSCVLATSHDGTGLGFIIERTRADKKLDYPSRTFYDQTHRIWCHSSSSVSELGFGNC